MLEPNYVSYLLNLVEKNKCEIGMNKNNYSDDNMNSSDREYVVSDEKAIEWIYLGNIFVAVWNKIYSMPFLKKNNILFDEKIWYTSRCRRFGAEISFTTHLFGKIQYISIK